MSRWINNWATIPDSPSARENGRTHGVCVRNDGCVVVFHQAENALLTYDPDGNLMSAIGGGRWLGAHGLTRVEEGGQEFLWLVDEKSAEVAKVTLDGEIVQQIEKPDHPIYEEKKYIPTWAAQNPNNGDIWVANGYGSYLVHRYNRDGDYLATLTGSEEEGAFREPHGLQFHCDSTGKPELFVTDRAKHLIQVFDEEGNYLRASRACHSPSCFDFFGDDIVVPELFTGVKILDRETLELRQEFGASDQVGPNPDGGWWPPVSPEGWPNLAGTMHLRPDVFNSPHGACFDADGNVFVVEWIVGGRITKIIR